MARLLTQTEFEIWVKGCYPREFLYADPSHFAFWYQMFKEGRKSKNWPDIKADDLAVMALKKKETEEE